MKEEELPEDRKEKQKVSKWPFLWGLLLYGPGNIDYVIIPFVLQPLGLSFWPMFWIASPLANLEIVGGFYFWRWFAWKWLPTTEPVKDTVELTKSIIFLLRKYGLLGTIIFKVRETYKWATGNSFSRFINSWGHLGMFGLGAESFISGGRLVGTVLCASMKWKKGLYSLIIGNTIHVIFSVWTWGLFFDFWDGHQRWFIAGIFAIILFVIGRHVQKSIKKEKEAL